jgi:tRNA pseudouridine55 synthase
LTEGIILLAKPAGQTSFQSLGVVKRRLGTGRVGHAGTLDRFAEGLLVALAGRMTRLSAFAASLDKEYIAVVSFGRGTDTLDPEGKVTSTGSVPSAMEIENVLPFFRGTFLQTPPAYSAVHVQGRRAYHAARAGEELVIPPRAVTIDTLELIDFAAPEVTLRVSCSKGTYIRSLARDIASKLGTCAFVSRLRRTRIGGFRLEDAKTPELFDPRTDLLPPAKFFDAAPGLRRLVVKESWTSRVGNGIALADTCFEEALDADGIFGAFSTMGKLLAVVERKAAKWRYAAAFPEERPDECRQERPDECRQERPEECRQERPDECRQERPEECRQERPEIRQERPEIRQERPDECRQERPE